MRRFPILLALLPLLARAEVVHLKTGAQIEGSLQSLTKTDLTLLKADGTSLTLSLNHVHEISGDDGSLIWREEAPEPTANAPGSSLSIPLMQENRAARQIPDPKKEVNFFGLRIGFNNSTFKFSDDSDVASIISLNAGVGHLSRKGQIGPRFEVFYMKRGFESDFETYSPTGNPMGTAHGVVTVEYLCLNPLVILYFSPNQKSPFIEFGFSLDFQLSDEVAVTMNGETETGSADFRHQNQSIVIGAGALIPGKERGGAMFDIRYFIGVSDIRDDRDGGWVKTRDVVFSIGLLI